MTHSDRHFEIQELLDALMPTILAWAGEGSCNFTEYTKVDTALKITRPTELRVDNAWKLDTDDGALVVAMEVQLSDLRGKQAAWDGYVTMLSREHGCPVVLIILTPDQKIAATSRTIAVALSVTGEGFM